MENLDNVILFKKKINPKKIPIHPLIEELDISNKVKRYFNKLEFYEIIEDYIVFSDKLKEIDEARANCWSFKVELKFCEINDIKAFYLAIISARRKFCCAPGILVHPCARREVHFILTFLLHFVILHFKFRYKVFSIRIPF